MAEPKKEKIDFKSRLGYYSELVAAGHLVQLLKDFKFSLSKETLKFPFASLLKEKQTELKRLMGSDQKQLTELKRNEDQGVALARSIFKGLDTADANSYIFDVKMTGDSAKGISKADLEITKTRKSNKEILKKLEISLKAYKTPTINLANATLISILTNLLTDSVGMSRKSAEESTNELKSKFGNAEKFDRLLSIQNIIPIEAVKRGGWKTLSETQKSDIRAKAKKANPEAIQLISDIFQSVYKNKKNEINKRMLKLMGLDGADSFYAAIGEGSKIKVIDSTTNKKYQELLNDLSKDFDISIEANSTGAGAWIKLITNNKELTKITIQISDSGGGGGAKTSSMMDFKQFL